MARRYAVLLLLLSVLVLPPAGAQTVAGHEWDLVAQLNRLRFDAGLDALVVRADLRALARDWSAQMVANGGLSHNPDVNRRVLELIPSRERVAENVARAATAPRLHELWRDSPTHHTNMVGDYGYVGIGLAGQYWGTQVFVKAPPGLPGETRVPVRRIAAADPIATALAVSRAEVPGDGAEAVVVARADLYPDALVGAPLAGANRGPVLLSDSAEVPAEVVAEAERALSPTGVVYLMGGPSALSPAVEARFLATGMRVQRVSGRDRFETAAKAATLLNPAPEEILVASGENFADALSASVPAAVHTMPIVLTLRDAVPPATALYLSSFPTARRTVVGGPAAVSEAAALQAGSTARVSGANRYATAVRIAQRWLPEPEGVWVATGDRHQDPLIAAPAAARARQPLLLVASTGDRTLYDYSRAHLTALRGATVVGGQASVRDPVLSLLFN